MVTKKQQPLLQNIGTVIHPKPMVIDNQKLIHTFLKGLISGNIFTQTAQSNPYQSAIPQVTTGSAPESGGPLEPTLADITINVITTGLTARPLLQMVTAELKFLKEF